MGRLKYYVCPHCGNVAGKIIDTGVPLVCCGAPMKELRANTTDGAVEKHAPVITRAGDKVTVQVGSVPHPMTEEHCIVWVTLVHGNRRESAFFKPGDSPAAEFCTDAKGLTAFAYCNLHGLWKTELVEN